MNKIDFRTSRYFPGQVIFLGLLLLIIGVPVFSVSLLGGFVLWFISLVIFTTHYRLRVDMDSKTYHDYLWILGMKRGEKGKFNTIEYLFIKKSMVTETMRLRVATTTIEKEIFDGYLKFSDQDKIHLLTMDSKENLINRMKSMAASLHVRILDYSEGNPLQI